MQHIILFRSTTTTTSPTILHIVNSVSTAQHSIIVMPPRLPHKAAIQQIFSPVLPASSTASRHAIIPTLRTYASRTNQAQQSSWQDQVAAGRVSSSIPASLGQRELSKVSEEWSALTGLASNVMNSDATTNTADSFKDTFNFFAKPRGNQTNSQKAAVDLSNDISEASLSRLRTKFVEGELYKPSDLSFEAYTKANNEVRRTRNQNKILVEGNVFKKHKITPIKHYKVIQIILLPPSCPLKHKPIYNLSFRNLTCPYNSSIFYLLLLEVSF